MKVGDNTYPNVAALLTGLSAGDREGDRSEVTNVTDYNTLPFIWKHYNRHPQCVTYYNEDYPLINTFNYFKTGFRSPPTHVYSRPYWMAMSLLGYSDQVGCAAGQTSYQLQLESLKQFLLRYKHNCTFSLMFHVRWGHTSEINDISAVDTDLANCNNTHSSRQKLFWIHKH